MRGPFLLRTPLAGFSLSAALFLASCAAPPTAPPGGKPPQGISSVDGANVEYAAFQNSAFPYRGLIPNYQETGKTRPFLDVDDNGRLGHSSPRGGLLWEDQTYNDRTVLLAAPQSFDPGRPGVIIVFFHGNMATLQRDVVARQQIVRQLAESGLNGVLVAPQLALDAPDSSAGKFWSPGGFAAFLNEAEGKLGDFYPGARNAFRRMPVVIVAYSGGYLPAVYSLTVGGEGGRVRGVVLLDALYGEKDKFVRWVEGPRPQRLLRQRLFDLLARRQHGGRGRTPAGRASGAERTARAACAGRGRLRRRGLGRPQRLRHLRLGRRAAARHFFAHPVGVRRDRAAQFCKLTLSVDRRRRAQNRVHPRTSVFSNRFHCPPSAASSSRASAISGIAPAARSPIPLAGAGRGGGSRWSLRSGPPQRPTGKAWPDPPPSPSPTRGEGIGKPSSAGARTSCASTRRPVDW